MLEHKSLLSQAELNQACELGKNVITQEAEALLKLATGLGEDFKNALSLIYSCEGRLVISGIGKSGHIGKKIAATMSSTGTPAFFLHPAEASHGDLGAMTKYDVLLAISNSGDSKELQEVLSYATRHNIKIIAITKNKTSLLGSQADICLILPSEAEACPIGCAPTSSTTMTLALGDALAMALIALRGFNAHDFKDFHPGGKLGSSLVRVENIMHTGVELPIIHEDALMSDAVMEMTAKGFGCIAVTKQIQNRQILIGIIADGDLRRHMGKDLLSKKVQAVMTREPTTIKKEALASKALGLMNSKGISGLMVVDEYNSLIGILHLHDCLRVGIN